MRRTPTPLLLPLLLLLLLRLAQETLAQGDTDGTLDQLVLSFEGGTVDVLGTPEVGTRAFEVEVAPSVENVTITASPTASGATMELVADWPLSGISGSTVPLLDGVPSDPLTLQEEAGNPVVVRVQPVDEAAPELFYAVTVVRQSADATLAALVPADGELAPPFSADTFSYNVSVPNEVTSLVLTPTASFVASLVTVNGATAASGFPADGVPLEVGENEVAVRVRAQDDVTVLFYNITATRAPSSSVALGLLEPAGFVPALEDGVLAYAITLGPATSALEVVVEAEHPEAVLELLGSEPSVEGLELSPPAPARRLTLDVSPLVVGSTAVLVRATAEDGTTQANYTLTVLRDPSTDASLASLAVDLPEGESLPACCGGDEPADGACGGGAAVGLAEPFNATAFEFSAALPAAAAVARVTAAATHPNAVVRLAARPAANLVDASQAVAPAATLELELNVTAEDGVTVRQHTLLLTRAPVAGLAAAWTPSGSATAAEPFPAQPVVHVCDSLGFLATPAGGDLSVALGVAFTNDTDGRGAEAEGGELSGGAAVSAAVTAGVAAFSGVSAALAATYTLSAELVAGGGPLTYPVPSGDGGSLNASVLADAPVRVVQGAAASAAVETQPCGVAINTLLPAECHTAVVVRDAGGNRVLGGDAPTLHARVSVDATGPPTPVDGTALDGATVADVDAGTAAAVFADLSVNRVTSLRLLVEVAAGAAADAAGDETPIFAAFTDAFDVSEPVPVRLEVSRAPASGQRATFEWRGDSAPRVRLLDGDRFGGSVVDVDSETVVRLTAETADAGEAALFGNDTAEAEATLAAGVADFEGLSLPTVGSYVLRASVAAAGGPSAGVSVADGVSEAFSIAVGPAASMMFVWDAEAAGAAAVDGRPFPDALQPSVELRDAGNNLVTTESGTTVTMWLAERPNATEIDEYLLATLPWLAEERRDLGSIGADSPLLFQNETGELAGATTLVFAGGVARGTDLRVTRPGPGYVVGALTGTRNYTGQANEANDTLALGDPLPQFSAASDPFTVRTTLEASFRVAVPSSLRLLLEPMVWAQVTGGTALFLILASVASMAVSANQPRMHRRHHWPLPYLALLYFQYVQLFIIPIEHVNELAEVFEAFRPQRAFQLNFGSDEADGGTWDGAHGLGPKLAAVVGLAGVGWLLSRYYFVLCCTQFRGRASMVVPALLLLYLPVTESLFDLNADNPTFLSLVPVALVGALGLLWWKRLRPDMERRDETAFFADFVPAGRGLSGGLCYRHDAHAQVPPPDNPKDPFSVYAASRGRYGRVYLPGEDEYEPVSREQLRAVAEGALDADDAGDDTEFEQEMAGLDEAERAYRMELREQARESKRQQEAARAAGYNPATAGGWAGEARREYRRWGARLNVLPRSSRFVQGLEKRDTDDHKAEELREARKGRMRNRLYDLWSRRREQWESYPFRALFETVVVYEPSDSKRRARLARRSNAALAEAAQAEKKGKGGGKKGKNKKGGDDDGDGPGPTARALMTGPGTSSSRYLNPVGPDGEPLRRQAPVVEAPAGSDSSSESDFDPTEYQRKEDSRLHRLRGHVSAYWWVVRLAFFAVYVSVAVPVEGEGNISTCYSILVVYLFALLVFAPLRNPFLQLDILYTVLLIAQHNIVLAVMVKPSRVWALAGVVGIQLAAIPLGFLVAGYYREPPLRRNIAEWVHDPRRDPLDGGGAAMARDFSAARLRRAPLPPGAGAAERYGGESDFDFYMRVGKIMWNIGGAEDGGKSVSAYRKDRRYCYAHFASAAKLDPGAAEPLGYLGAYYREVTNNATKAARLWTAALRLDAADRMAGVGLARLYLRHGEPDKAQSLCERAQLEALEREDLGVRWPDDMLAEIALFRKGLGTAAEGRSKRSRRRGGGGRGRRRDRSPRRGGVGGEAVVELGKV